MITTQKDSLCKDPKAAADQLGAMMAKMAGGGGQSPLKKFEILY
jgi:hypothetical protein